MMNTSCAQAQIYVDGRYYLLYERSPLSQYPHMVDRETGEMPFGNQRSLLKKYLLQMGVDIEPWHKRNTHWCVREAIKVSSK